MMGGKHEVPNMFPKLNREVGVEVALQLLPHKADQGEFGRCSTRRFYEGE